MISEARTTSIPIIHPPFHTTLNPATSQIDTYALAWAQHWGFLDQRGAEMVRAAKISYLIGWAYPTASADALKLLHLWNVWLLLWEEQCSATTPLMHPSAMHLAHQRFLAILRPGSGIQPTNPMEYALADLTPRLSRATSGAWLQRFRTTVAQLFGSWKWEALNRQQQRWPSESEYLAYRPRTVALMPYVDLIRLAAERPIARSVTSHPALHRLAYSASLIIGIANDVLSYAKERREGDLHNLAVIVEQQRKLSPDASLHYITTLHDAEVAIFHALRTALPTFGPAQADCDLYVTTLCNWIAANVYWSDATVRYGRQQQAALRERAHGATYAWPHSDERRMANDNSA